MEKTISNEQLKRILQDVCICENYVEGMIPKIKGEALKDELQAFLFRLQTAHKSLLAYLMVKRGEEQKEQSKIQEWMNELKKIMIDDSLDYIKELIQMIKKAQKLLSQNLQGSSLHDPQLHRILHILYDDYAAAIYCFDRYFVTMK